MQPGVVIVGGGQAGLEAAAALRTLGYDGTVTLICEEAHAPYQRPPLSKSFLTGKQEADGVFLRARLTTRSIASIWFSAIGLRRSIAADGWCMWLEAERLLTSN